MFGDPSRDFRAEPPEIRSLRDAARNTRFFGWALAAFGLVLIAIVAFGDAPGDWTLPAAAISLVVLTPAATYIVASYFLVARRYWAWVAILAVTVLIGIGALGLVVMATVAAVREGIALIAAFPIVMAVCWGAAIAIILGQLHRSLRVVREAEAIAHKGFAVIPVAKPAASQGFDDRA